MGRIFSVLVVLTAVLASTAAQAADDSGIRARVEQLVSQLVDEDQDKSARDVATEELAAILKASTDNAKDSARRHLTDIGMPLVHAIVDVLDSDSRTARLAACACLTELGAAAEGAVPYLLAPTVPDDAEFRIVARKAGAEILQAKSDAETVRIIETWVLICSALVLFMQAGFCLLESGLSRAKSSIDAAIKNLFDFCVAGAFFWAVGYGLMFGPSWNDWGFIGWGNFFFVDDTPEHWPSVFFLFQLVYCGTSVTIASGAVAERMRLIPYLLVNVLVVLLIYPLFGHWVWSGIEGIPLEEAKPVGWLARWSFVDFAGSTVVHSLGAWVALAAVCYVGPRVDKYRNDQVVRLHGHNLPMATLGVFILWFGWIGFTGGRQFTPDPEVPYILVVTVLAGVAGGVGAFLTRFTAYELRRRLFAMRRVRQFFEPVLVWSLPCNARTRQNRIVDWIQSVLRRFRKVTLLPLLRGNPEASRFTFSLETVMNGVLAGLVAICASCNQLAYWQAIVIGATAAVLMYFASYAFEHWFHWDDVVGAISVHGVAGAWGTIAVGLFVDIEKLPVQLFGVVVCFGWAFFLTLAALWIMEWLAPSLLRVCLTDDEQLSGANVTDHDARVPYADLRATMTRHAQSGESGRLETGVLQGRALVEVGSEDAAMAAQYNEVCNRLEQASLAKTRFLSTMSHELLNPLAAIKDGADGMLMTQITEAHRTKVEGIRLLAEHSLTQFEDLLFLGRIGEARIALELVPLDLPEFLVGVVEPFRPRAATRSLAPLVITEKTSPTIN